MKELLDPKTGIEVKDRQYHLKTYEKCFIGSELATWLLAFLKKTSPNTTREEAITLAKKLHSAKLFAHVVDPHPFKDDFFFYLFQISKESENGH